MGKRSYKEIKKSIDYQIKTLKVLSLEFKKCIALEQDSEEMWLLTIIKKKGIFITTILKKAIYTNISQRISNKEECMLISMLMIR